MLQLDFQGVVLACPQCGQRNRIAFDRLEPRLILIANGREAARTAGARPASAIQSFIEQSAVSA